MMSFPAMSEISISPFGNSQRSDTCLLYPPGTLHQAHPLYTELGDPGCLFRSVISCVDNQKWTVDVFEESVQICIPSTKQRTSFVPDFRSCEDQRRPFEFKGDPLPGTIDRSSGVPLRIEPDSVYIPGKRYELDMSSAAITKMDTLTNSLLQDAIDKATRRNCTMVLESIIYRDGHAEWIFEEIADVQGPDAIPTAQIDVTTDGSSTRQVPYEEARRILAGAVMIVIGRNEDLDCNRL